MSAKVKEKLSHMQKDDAKYRELIENFKKSLELWFINGFDNDNLSGIQLSCLEILTHGLMALKVQKFELKVIICDWLQYFLNALSVHNLHKCVCVSVLYKEFQQCSQTTVSILR